MERCDVQVWECDGRNAWFKRNKIQIHHDTFELIDGHGNSKAKVFTMGNGDALLTLSPDSTKVEKWIWNKPPTWFVPDPEWEKTGEMQVDNPAAIALSADNSVIATASKDNGNKRRIQVHTDRAGVVGNWEKKGEDIVIDKWGEYIQLKLSADGSVAAVGMGSHSAAHNCYVYMYKWSNAYGWQKLGHGLGNGGVSGTYQNSFGKSMAMNSAGNVLAVADDKGVRVFHVKETQDCGSAGRQVVNWIYRTNAITKNPHWYPGLSPDATPVEIQNYLYENKHKNPTTGELWCERPSCYIY
jgi:hypothetical protein